VEAMPNQAVVDTVTMAVVDLFFVMLRNRKLIIHLPLVLEPLEMKAMMVRKDHMHLAAW